MPRPPRLHSSRAIRRQLAVVARDLKAKQIDANTANALVNVLRAAMSTLHAEMLDRFENLEEALQNMRREH